MRFMISRLNPRFGLGAVAWLVVCLVTADSRAADVDAYFADAIWTGVGPVVHQGVLVVEDGKIVAVGSEQMDLPASARKHQLGAVTLIPGLVIAQTGLVEAPRDQEFAVSPEVRAIDGFDPFRDYQSILAGGVTTVEISPGVGRLMPGQGAVVKLAGNNLAEQTLVDSESLRIVLTRAALSPPTIYEPPVGAVSVDRPLEPTRPQLATSLAEAIVGLRAMLAEAHDIAGGKVTNDRILQTLADWLEERRTFRITAEVGAEVQAAMMLAQEFNLNWLLVDPTDVDRLVKEVDWTSISAKGVIFNPEMRPGQITNPNVPIARRNEPKPVWERVKSLVSAGAGDKIALRASSDDDLEKMLFLAALLGRGGLTTDEILRMLTVNPAKMLGVSERVGSLKPQADADFVVLTGAPFALGTRVAATYVNGKRVFEAPTEAASYVMRAGSVYTPKGVLSDASISVTDGKIGAVGTSVSLPSGAITKDYGNAVIVPGFLDLAADLGMGGTLSDQVSFDTKLGELLARDDQQISVGRQGGVTTAFLSSTRLPSPVVAFKLLDRPRALKDPVALRFEISGNLTAAEESVRNVLRSGKAYADAWTKYEADFADYQKKLKEYEAAKQVYDAALKAAADKKAAEDKKAADAKKAEAESKGKPSENPPADQEKPTPKPESGTTKEPVTDPSKSTAAEAKSDPSETKPDSAAGKDAAKKDGGAEAEKKLEEPKKPDEPKKPRETAALEVYRDLFAGKLVAMVDVSETKAVELAVKLFRTEFDIKTAVVAGQAAVANSQLLAKNEVLVVVGPTLVEEQDGKLINFASQLALHQIPLGFQSKASTGTKVLSDAVAYAVYEGLGRDNGLAGLTSQPASFFGLDAIGSIQVGKDADLVVLSGPPLDLASEVIAVMIDGRFVYEKESQ